MKYVLITGVSTGIRNDAVRFLIAKGFHVLASVRKEADAKSLSKQYPDHFTCLIFDVTNTDQVKAILPIVEEVLSSAKLSGLVNNAGLALGGPIELMDDEKFRCQMEVNLFSVQLVG